MILQPFALQLLPVSCVLHQSVSFSNTDMRLTKVGLQGAVANSQHDNGRACKPRINYGVRVVMASDELM
jgi:hypothetical protein